MLQKELTLKLSRWNPAFIYREGMASGGAERNPFKHKTIIDARSRNSGNRCWWKLYRWVLDNRWIGTWPTLDVWVPVKAGGVWVKEQWWLQTILFTIIQHGVDDIEINGQGEHLHWRHGISVISNNFIYQNSVGIWGAMAVRFTALIRTQISLIIRSLIIILLLGV